MKQVMMVLLGIALLGGGVCSRTTEAGVKEGEHNDLVDLIARKKVEVQTQGEGIESVSLKIRRLVNEDMTVYIPVGTFFVARRASTQNMVATADKTVMLRNNEWVSVSIPAACANRPRDIPGSDDHFSVQRSPKQKELQRLMPVLRRAAVTFAVQQAAVWIVTDNATYDDLGILLQSFGPIAIGGSRLIDEEDAARAMRICDETGIDITQKAIWQDRNKILPKLRDDALRQWLQKKARR